ncbi:GNAT family N-acetyltransferase [Bdellovibrionota bacterium FG-2]
MLTLKIDNDIPAFLAAVTPTLESNPTLHSFILSLAERTHTRGLKAALLARGIAPVCTPKHLRGHGYASALTAAVSQRYVDLGKKCLLFTDLSNPTSNSIYQKIGYRPVTDFRHIDFY